MDEIISMAAKAYITPTVEFTPMTNEALKRFADLVRAAECEACLEIADHCADADMHASMAANAIRARSKNQG